MNFLSFPKNKNGHFKYFEPDRLFFDLTTQFGSDLDQVTKAKLDRGKRTQEVLKQGLHKTLDMEEEAMILYALTHG